ncbi:MAG: thiamine phosphate synthase [Alphaproteobacteria bacterium]
MENPVIPAEKLVIIQDCSRQSRERLQYLLDNGFMWFSLRDEVSSAMAMALFIEQILPMLEAYHASLSSHRQQFFLAEQFPLLGLHWQVPLLPTLEGRDKGKSLWGCSCHGAQEIEQATAAGVDYITLSPVYPPISKQSFLPPLGEEQFSALCKQTHLPVLALGGMRPSMLPAMKNLGAAGIALMGGVMGDVEKIY